MDSLTTILKGKKANTHIKNSVYTKHFASAIYVTRKTLWNSLDGSKEFKLRLTLGKLF
jgi:hypothetical protein